MNVEVFKEYIVRLIAARHPLRHVRRLGIMEMFEGAAVEHAPPPAMAQRLLAASRATGAAILAELGSHEDGLSAAEANAIRARTGANIVLHERPMPWWDHLWNCYNNPFNLLLTALALVSFYTDDIKAAIVIGFMVLLSTMMRFVQELRSNKAAEKLKDMVSNTATVLRRDLAVAPDVKRGAPAAAATTATAAMHPHACGRPHIETPIRLLVPGDVVLLAAGDMIPADLRLIAARDLFVSQSAMTGESLPVEKFVAQRAPDASNPLELDNICFMGTNVVSGAATAVVVTTGNATFFGALAERVTAVDRRPTAFQAGVNKVSWLLIRFMFLMVPVVFLLNGFTKGDWLEAFLFALSVAVGLTPEMLPMIVTSTLAKGAVVLSRKKVIVKRLDAIQNFGAMDVLCTDKTGTLTQDRIVLERHTDAFGAESDHVLEYAWLNSYYQTGLKNLLDVAVLEDVELHRDMTVAGTWRKIDEIPFDFNRRRMSVVVADGVADRTAAVTSNPAGRHLLICKGAVEETLAICTGVERGDSRGDSRGDPRGNTREAMTPEVLARIRTVTADLNDQGLRVVAVAVKELPPGQDVYAVADECDLVLVGYIAFLDPPKDSTGPALAALTAHGIEVKILTGDNEAVTAKICRQVGLDISGMLSGAQIEAMTDADLGVAAERTTVFSKLSPSHKERIVRALHDRGHVVGFMGDGINDAPALRAADIGISVDTAVDIAKEAADLILLEKSLMVLDAGVIEGRRTFANMLKYIKMTASSNFGNVFSVLIASAFLPFLPMLPLQLLVQNLLYDISQVAIPFDNVDSEFLDQPRHWKPEDIGRFMIFFGPISSIFDVATFAVLGLVFHADTVAQQSLFQSGWFVEGLLSQTLIVHMIRTRRIPFIQSRASWPLMGATLAIISVGILLPMSPLAGYFHMQALPAAYFAWLAAILAGYMILTQTMKYFYIRRFGWQ